MQARRGFILAGSLWGIVRFFLVISLIAMLLQKAAASPWIVPWLLVVGSSNLPVAVAGIMLALFPARYAGVIGPLRLGAALAPFSFLLLVISGALRLAIGRELFSLGGLVFTQGMAFLAIFLLDLLFLILLLSRPSGEGEGHPPAGVSDPSLPEHDETEVKDYH